MPAINLRRTHLVLRPDPRRVLARPLNLADDQRANTICRRVMALPEAEVGALLDQLENEFGGRHLETRAFLKRRYEEVRHCFVPGQELSRERELLVGAYFSNEYSLEAAALFNPSIVPHPDQSEVPPGSLRFVLSLRATGEGHISSITFRTGVLDADANITLDAASRYSLEPALVPHAAYEKHVFERKLDELGLADGF